MSETPRKIKANGHIVQADWNQTDPLKMDYIHNKPEMPGAACKQYVNEQVQAVKDYVDTQLEGKQNAIIVGSGTPEIPLFQADTGVVSTVIVDSYDENSSFQYSTTDILPSYKHIMDEVSTDLVAKYAYMTLYADGPTHNLHVANKQYVDFNLESKANKTYVDTEIQKECKLYAITGDNTTDYYYLTPGYIYEVYGIGSETFKVATEVASHVCNKAVLMNDIAYIQIDGNPIGQKATAIMNTGGGLLVVKRYKRYTLSSPQSI